MGSELKLPNVEGQVKGILHKVAEFRMEGTENQKNGPKTEGDCSKAAHEN